MTYSQVGAGVPRPAKTRDPRSRVGKCTAAAGEGTAIAKWINQGRGEVHSAPGDSQNIVIVRVRQKIFWKMHAFQIEITFDFKNNFDTVSLSTENN